MYLNLSILVSLSLYNLRCEAAPKDPAYLALDAYNAPEIANSTVTQGTLVFPRPRNLDDPKLSAFGADGIAVCGGGARSHWDKTLSGDVTFGSAYVDPPTKVIAGALLEIAFAFDQIAHGGGIVALEICEQPTYPNLTEDCFLPLKRDPLDLSISPYSEAHPHLLFLPEKRCLRLATLDQPFTARYHIPDSVAPTTHAVLRWLYMPAESCNPAPEDTQALLDGWQASWMNTTCIIPPPRNTSCGAECPGSLCYGRVFKNCADVAIDFADPAAPLAAASRTPSPQEVAEFGPDAGFRDWTAHYLSRTQGPHVTIGARPKIVNAEHFEVQELKAAPEEDTDYCGDELDAQLSLCESQIKDVPGLTEPNFCKQMCAKVVQDLGSLARHGCINNGVCDLTACVISFWGQVCHHQ